MLAQKEVIFRDMIKPSGSLSALVGLFRIPSWAPPKKITVLGVEEVIGSSTEVYYRRAYPHTERTKNLPWMVNSFFTDLDLKKKEEKYLFQLTRENIT